MNSENRDDCKKTPTGVQINPLNHAEIFTIYIYIYILPEVFNICKILSVPTCQTSERIAYS